MSNLIFLLIVLVILAVAIFIAMKTDITLSDEAYDRLKVVAEVFCPGLNIFIIAITKVYNIPGGIEAAAFVTAFGVLLLTIVKGAKKTWTNLSDEDLQLNRELEPDYVGERYFTDENGVPIVEEDDDLPVDDSEVENDEYEEV